MGDLSRMNQRYVDQGRWSVPDLATVAVATNRRNYGKVQFLHMKSLLLPIGWLRVKFEQKNHCILCLGSLKSIFLSTGISGGNKEVYL